MTPLPKRRHSTRRSGKRRAAIHVAAGAQSKCPQCGAAKVPHRVCGSCGYYAGREAVKQKVVTAKKK